MLEFVKDTRLSALSSWRGGRKIPNDHSFHLPLLHPRGSPLKIMSLSKTHGDEGLALTELVVRVTRPLWLSCACWLQVPAQLTLKSMKSTPGFDWIDLLKENDFVFTCVRYSWQWSLALFLGNSESNCKFILLQHFIFRWTPPTIELIQFYTHLLESLSSSW